MGRDLAERCGPVLAERHVLGPLVAEGLASGIFEAEDARTARTVIVKLLAVTDPGAPWARLCREALAGRVEHPGVCAPFDMGEERGVPFVVSERLRGETLAEAITNGGPLPLEFVVPVFVELASALHAIHDAGVIHRDIKPSNIFLVQRERCRPVPRFFDFGCASEIDRKLDDAVFGTPAYMAPEQARGDAIDARADIHAFGVALFESIAGRRPYAAQSYERLFGPAPPAEPPDVRAIRVDTPPLLASIVARALTPARENRFASARAMQDALMLLTRSGSHRTLTDARAEGELRSGWPVLVGPSRPHESVGDPQRRESVTRVAAAGLQAGRPHQGHHSCEHTSTKQSAEDFTLPMGRPGDRRS
jgi:serine/threonine-protein kinase